MAKASINFAKGSSHSFIHNDRSEEIEPWYLLPVEHRLENEVNRSASEAQALFDQWFEEAKQNYKETYGQKFQGSKQNSHWEAAINLNPEHTLEDVERLVKEIERETGFRAMQISIHRDEGHLNEKTGHPIYNLHAHVNFFTLDEKTGKQRFRLSISKSEREKLRKDLKLKEGEKIPTELVGVIDKAKLSKLQDITARELKMVRGKKGSEAVRLNPRQKRAVEKSKVELEHKIVDLTLENKKLDYNFREMQKRITALENVDTEQKKELHRLNTELNKSKDSVDDRDKLIADLEAKIAKLSVKAEKYDEALRDGFTLRSENRQLRRELEELKTQKVEPVIVTDTKEIEDLNRRIEILKITNTGLKKELEETKSATVLQEVKGENEASKAVEGHLSKMPKEIKIPIETDSLEYSRIFWGIEDLNPNWSKGREYAAELIAKHTRLGIVNKEALADELGEQFQKGSSFLERAGKITDDLKRGYDKAIDVAQSNLKSAKMAFKDVFSKITGKSTDQVQNERREAENKSRPQPTQSTSFPTLKKSTGPRLG